MHHIRGGLMMADWQCRLCDSKRCFCSNEFGVDISPSHAFSFVCTGFSSVNT
ncbi:hypothetical protein GQ55_8G060100 [Panicum hallii var. hallii]|uniref:Uncharacterized protein n=1 Tax=Panicum hallii var. hallii TaxID=1504633 RepID=A0A2T7CL65_9POAL|nr:hypothetical protein GQ55_8G060100 [Panicum hallii var. hallii]